MNKITCVVLGFLLFSHTSYGCSNEVLAKHLAQFIDANGAGISALIANRENEVCLAASGMANTELSVSMEPHHVFEIGSITKQFTAVAILLLAQENKLKLDDSIALFIPGISTTKAEVTIAHLLSHTSGLVDPINEAEFLRTRVQEPISLESLIGQFKNGHWQHTPGERVVYTNVGYSMLAYVIEQVSERRYVEFLAEKIFTPLEMQNTWQASFAIHKHKVAGYTYQDNELRQNDFLNLSWAYGAGDLVSNVNDLFFFKRALMDERILNDTYLALFLKNIRLNDGTVTNGSFTSSLQKVGELNVFRASGSTMGYSSHMAYIRESDTFIAVLQNVDGINGGNWTAPSAIVASLIAKELKFPLPNYQRTKVPQKQVPSLVGTYKLDGDTTRFFSNRDGKFYYRRNEGTEYEVIPMANNGFFFKDTLSYFYINGTGTTEQHMSFYYPLATTPEIATLQ